MREGGKQIVDDDSEIGKIATGFFGKNDCKSLEWEPEVSIIVSTILVLDPVSIS